jgi:hypothetical protein
VWRDFFWSTRESTAAASGGGRLARPPGGGRWAPGHETERARPRRARHSGHGSEAATRNPSTLLLRVRHTAGGTGLAPGNPHRQRVGLPIYRLGEPVLQAATSLLSHRRSSAWTVCSVRKDQWAIRFARLERCPLAPCCRGLRIAASLTVRVDWRRLVADLRAVLDQPICLKGRHL